MALEDQKMIEKYKEAIKKEARCTEEIYEDRLSVCKACDYLNEGTCHACGCYVELRALGKEAGCPYRKWKR